MSDLYDLRGEEPDNRKTSRSKSGNPVHRYTKPAEEPEFAPGDGSLINAVTDHISKHLGEGMVLHEIMSTTVHVDIHVVPPTDERPFYTLVTSGMAERPMRTPAGVDGCEFAELVVCLPPDWPGFDDTLMPGNPDHPWSDEANYWPIRWLKMLARFPHEYGTWLWMNHTVPNGDPPEPFAPNTKLCGWLVGLNPLLPEAFNELRIGDRDIVFFSLIPLCLDEMQLKLDKGAETLWELFDKHNVSPVIDVARDSVAGNYRGKKPWWKFW